MRSLIVGFALVLWVVPVFADTVTVDFGDFSNGNKVPVLNNTALNGSELSLTFTWSLTGFIPNRYSVMEALVFWQNNVLPPDFQQFIEGSGTGYFLDAMGDQITPTSAFQVVAGQTPVNGTLAELLYLPPFDNKPPPDSFRGVHLDMILPESIPAGALAQDATFGVGGQPPLPEPATIVSLVVGLAAVLLMSRRLASYSSSRS
jgi:hypothetical protein